MKTPRIQKVVLLLALAFAFITLALSISALRTYKTTIPASAIVVKVETKKSLSPNPISEENLLNPSAFRESYLHSIYVKVPHAGEAQGDAVLYSTAPKAPAIGDSLKIRYRMTEQSIEVFPEDLLSIFAPALLPGVLTLVTLFFAGLMNPQKQDN